MAQKPDAREEVYFVLTSFAHVVVTVLFGELLDPPRLLGLSIIAFALTSKAFALFVGENERFFSRSRWVAAPLAAVSIAILLFLPPVEMVLGAVVMVLYLTYPRILNARERSPLDVLFHGSRYALIFWLGYAGAVTPVSVSAVAIIFLFGVTGELLVGLRDTERWGKATASKLGVTSTVRIVNILTFVLILLTSILFSQIVNFPLLVGPVAVPVPLLVGIVMAVFLTRPMNIGRSRYAPISVRRREVAALLVLFLIFVAVPLAIRVNLASATQGPDYTANIGMQTVITGPQTSDGQWILFNYEGQNDYYYLLLHTNGVLELSRDANGTSYKHLDDVQTNLSPFNWHEYEIQVSGGVATISIDGKRVMTAPIQDPGGEVKVSQYSPHPNYWVVLVTEFQVSSPPDPA